MKIRRILSVLLILTLSVLLLTACEGKKDAWTLNEALKMVGTEQAAALNGRIPLSDDFSAYDCYSDGEYIAGSGKILILQREGPEKEFSRSSFPYPDDYRGEDKGTAKVWLRADLMNRIPEDRRASTTEEAETIIMADTYYQMTATLGSEGKSISGMNYDEYHPLFCALHDIRLYSCENKGAQSIVWEEYCYPELRAYPEADDLWLAIAAIESMLETAHTEPDSERLESLIFCLDNLYFYEALPLSVLDRLYENCIDGDTEEIIKACTDALWGRAAEFMELDPDYAEEFSQIITAQDYDALEKLIFTLDYSAIDLTDSEMIDRRAYMGTPDPERMTALIDEALSFLDDVEWNMTDARRILMYGY